MLNEVIAKEVIHSAPLSRLQQLLVLIAVGQGPKTVRQVKDLAVSCGLRPALKWNISDCLSKSGGLAINTDKGWELTGAGRAAVANVANVRIPAAVVVKAASDVRRHLDKIGSQHARQFIEEAVCCFENGLFRAAIVFSWVGAIAILHAHVATNCLAEFNAESKRRDPRWKDARNADELGRMKEHDFLDVLEAIGKLGKNVKQILQEQCLKLRNACGHPSSLKVSENNVAAHLDTLVLNVYSEF